MSGKNRLGCFGARDRGRCDNHPTIRRDEVEGRVLRALRERLLQQDLFEEFCDEFTSSRQKTIMRIWCKAIEVRIRDGFGNAQDSKFSANR
jgi:hypothetical protein